MKILSMKERAELRKTITHKRVDTLLPPLMEELGIDMWIIPCGDFNIDPVQPFLVEEELSYANVIVISNCNGKFEKFINSGFNPLGEDVFYKSFVQRGEDLYAALARVIAERKPRSIAVNTSEEFSILSGISHTDYEKVKAAAGDIPLVSAEELAMHFLQHRTEEELLNYEVCAELSRELINETYTRKVITPGVTTTDDVRWFMRQWMTDRGLDYTWGPNCDLQRKGSSDPMIGTENGVEVILPGDLLHIDFGISYLQTETDMQYLCYIPLEGETEVPAGFVEGFNKCREFQQIYMDTVRPDVTGNQLWREILEKAEKAGLKAMVYSHPIGFHVHGVGASIGRFGGTPDIPHGNYIVRNNMCFAMEQNVRVNIPEWDGQEIFIFREEDVALIDGKVRVIGKLQPEMYILK
jgi:Xaa-Pro aminopeptidase